MNKDIEDKLDALEKKVASLEERVRNAEKFVPGGYWNVPQWAVPTACSKCGLKIEGTMGYVCNRNDCPTGLGPAIC